MVIKIKQFQSLYYRMEIGTIAGIVGFCILFKAAYWPKSDKRILCSENKSLANRLMLAYN
jgi:hypothetical protein